ncbi:hypothetical protein [Tautonia rosea]|nr:hypothetical protein [Tautonia rosea]
MASCNHLRRASWIAVVAIFGMFCAMDGASACSNRTDPASKVAGSCRMDREPGGCGCCSGPGSTAETIPARSATSLPSAFPSPRLPLVDSCESCVCRAGESSPPASRSESRPVEERPSSSTLPLSLIAAILSGDRPGAASCSAPSDAAGFPRVPIYLRTLHLLN